MPPGKNSINWQGISYYLFFIDINSIEMYNYYLLRRVYEF